MDDYADAVFSEPGRCWRMVYDGEGSGRPMHCPEPAVEALDAALDEVQIVLPGEAGDVIDLGRVAHAEGPTTTAASLNA